MFMPALSFAQVQIQADRQKNVLIFEAEGIDGSKVNSFYQYLSRDINRFISDTCLITYGNFEIFITDSNVDSVFYLGYLPDNLVTMIKKNIQESSGSWRLDRLSAGKQFKVIQQVTLDYSILRGCKTEVENIGRAFRLNPLNLKYALYFEENFFRSGVNILLYPVILDSYNKR